MRILDERREALVERERELLERLVSFLKDFGAPSEDIDLVRRAHQDLEELFLLVIVGSNSIRKCPRSSTRCSGPTSPRRASHRNGPHHAVASRRQARRERQAADSGEGDSQRVLREIAIVDTPGTNAIIRHAGGFPGLRAGVIWCCCHFRRAAPH